MAPETRSRGVPPPSRVYHSTPSLQQAQFPPRRRVVRTYGGKNAPQSTPGSARARDPRQSTLTQLEWVSSSLSEAQTVVLSDDSEEDDFATEDDKENEGPAHDEEEEEEEEEEEGEQEEQPGSSGKRKRRSKRVEATADKKSKRRRTLGDQTEVEGNKTKKKTKKEESSRRKTMGDTPSAKYHTQTLTQLLGRDDAAALIRDSEDEDDDGFDDWLQAPDSPSPRSRTLPQTDGSPEQPSRSAEGAARQENTSRQSSVVPQTPAKRAIRFEIPSSSQQSTPITARMLDRYGPPDEENPSPSVRGGRRVLKPITELPGKPKGTPRKLVIEDSFATESWESGGGTPHAKGTPLKDITEQVTGITDVGVRRESSSMSEMMSTPSRPRRRGESAELGEKTPTRPRSFTKDLKRIPTPRRVSIGGVFEIPDSDEDDEDFSDEDDDHGHPEETASPGTDQENVAPTKPNKVMQNADRDADGDDDDYGYIAGPETQLAMDELASSEDSSNVAPQASRAEPSPRQQQPSSCSTFPLEPEPSQPPLPQPKSSSPRPAAEETTPRSKPSKPLRKPIRHLPPSSQTQPLESQRVPLSTIQAFGNPTNRTDIFLQLPPSTIDTLVSGHQLDLSLQFKVPPLVSRFWIFDGNLLRYVACVEPGQEDLSRGYRLWRYRASQMYELNNPLDVADMTEEGWLDEQDLKQAYIYFPPVGVSQLLANLRHALFREDGDEEDNGDTDDEEQDEERPTEALPPPAEVGPDRPSSQPVSSFSISQQVEAQLRSDIAHQTQSTRMATSDPVHADGGADHDDDDDDDDILVPSTPPKDRTPRPPRPSQATTASQASTPDKPTQEPPPLPPPGGTFRRPPLPQSSSTGLTFQDHDSSSPPFLLPCSNPGTSLRSSQLLTKSQMLSDSLVRDDPRVPPEIWDSDEEEEEHDQG
ncbi:hypothetical protein ACRE_031100 [Hapsidospora chrysogenum ATCC 11550]|uniref:Uncharacterized protein n=1 Tax=Hapsidospora chrysogenum (strain ATCC 11550 / CBS 779.69 / DSM 880 / IAM 14645 / JCM 23072 / IMI 49137) TaxID=857340 RepID=A0A086T9S6_HAPC1|nr:hypothetical protein ACRE_031100 [Hapsidospora chrysogenum ATCC 11550]